VRRELAIDREKLAVYSWPDAAHSDKPLFEITVKPHLLGRRSQAHGVVPRTGSFLQAYRRGKKDAEAIVSKKMGAS